MTTNEVLPTKETKLPHKKTWSLSVIARELVLSLIKLVWGTQLSIICLQLPIDIRTLTETSVHRPWIISSIWMHCLETDSRSRRFDRSKVSLSRSLKASRMTYRSWSIIKMVEINTICRPCSKGKASLMMMQEIWREQRLVASVKCSKVAGQGWPELLAQWARPGATW